MRSSQTQANVVECILKESRAHKRKDLIRLDNEDQINAVSELTFNLLKNKLLLQPQHVIRLKPYRKQMRNVVKNPCLRKKKARHFTQSARKWISQSSGLLITLTIESFRSEFTANL